MPPTMPGGDFGYPGYGGSGASAMQFGSGGCHQASDASDCMTRFDPRGGSCMWAANQCMPVGLMGEMESEDFCFFQNSATACAQFGCMWINNMCVDEVDKAAYYGGFGPFNMNS